MDLKALWSILGVGGLIVFIVISQKFSNEYNKRKRYEAKVKAGLVKEGEALVPETEEQKKAKMDAAMQLYANLQKDKKNKE